LLSFVTAITWQLVLGSALIVAFLALLGEAMSRIVRRLGKRAGLKDVTLVTIRDATRAIWIVLAIVGVAFYTKLASDLTVLAVSTVGGLILSLALQATLSNVIAGLFMLEDGTLRVDDEITYSGITGRVIRIALRTSWIMTEKGDIVTVSNSNLMGGPLTIHTGTHRLVAKYRLESLVPSQPKSEAPAETASGKSSGAAPSQTPDQGKAKTSEKRVRKSTAKDPERGEA
jgi:small-conductance mechanosensitive channel